MGYTEVEQEYREGLRNGWERFLTQCATFDGSQDSFHAVNKLLGFNLAKSVGPLILDIEKLELSVSQKEILIRALYRKIDEQDKAMEKAIAKIEKQREYIKLLEIKDDTSDLQ